MIISHTSGNVHYKIKNPLFIQFITEQLCNKNDMINTTSNTAIAYPTNAGPYATTATLAVNSNYSSNTITTSNYDYFSPAINSQDHYYNTIKEIVQEYDKEKEKENMTTDFSFGPYNTSSIRLSPYGMAIKNKAGKWISYNKTTDRLMDVDVINVDIDSAKIFYKIPRAVNSVKPGDIILHNTTPVFVEVINNGRFTVINPYEGTEITILPAQSPFGFDFVTAIVTLTDFMPAADENNPFGNLLPFMLMGKDNNNNMGLMLALSGGMKDMDPMMMMALCGGGDMSTLLMLSMMKKNKLDFMCGPGVEDKDE